MSKETKDTLWGLLIASVVIGVYEYWQTKHRRDAGLPSEW